MPTGRSEAWLSRGFWGAETPGSNPGAPISLVQVLGPRWVLLVLCIVGPPTAGPVKPMRSSGLLLAASTEETQTSRTFV